MGRKTKKNPPQTKTSYGPRCSWKVEAGFCVVVGGIDWDVNKPREQREVESQPAPTAGPGLE